MTTLSEHTYTARVLDVGGDLVLSLDEDNAGGVSLDAGRIPHVESSVTVAVEDPALLAQLDPRQSRRVVLSADAVFPSGTSSRLFDLGIRTATPDRAAGTVRLELASDEAILSDHAQLVDDGAPRTFQSSLRAVCEYVLGKVPGVARNLEPGGPDADVTAYWPVASLVSNPSFETNMDGWAAGTNATTPARFSDTAQGEVYGDWVARWASSAAGSSYIDYQDISVRPGTSYVLTAYMYSEAAARKARVMIRFKAGNGTTLRDFYSTTTLLKTTVWKRLSVIGIAPPGTEKATLHLEHISTAAGQAVRADGVMFHEGTEVIEYHDGATVDTAAYDYAWTGAAHASNSTRTPSVERPPEALVWRAGVSGMSFLEPLLKAAGLRLVCDELRRWTLRDTNYRADGNQMYRHGVNIETAEESLSRDDDAWFDAAVYEYTWTDLDGAPQRRIDAFELTARPTKVLRVEVQDTPFPGPGRAEHIVRRAQSRGRTVTASAIPTWTEQTDQPLSVLLEGTPIQTGIAGSVRYDFSADTVTVTSRTADTPAAAWILIPVGERWTDSPTGGTWKNEVI